MCQTFKTRAPRVGETAPFEASGVAMTASINLAHKLATFSDHFAPRTVATFNGLDIMVVKIKGAFQWHSHSDSDDFFLVLQGRMRVETEHGQADMGPGEIFIVPRGVRHRPVADDECHVMLIEPTGLPNTGDAATAAPRRVI
jgi:mannose-6-phosphate isomerase-like protein (cupin superfamily)